MFNMYPDLVNKLNELLEENKKYKKMLQQVPKSMKFILSTTKQFSEEDREEWKKLYEEAKDRSQNDVFR